MRTHDYLQDYHWKQIREQGFTKGKEVWFADPECYDDKYVKKGNITNHFIHLEGDIQLEVEFIDEYEWEVPDNIWMIDETVRSGVSEDKMTRTVLMDWTFFTKEEAVECVKQILNTKIGRSEKKIEHIKHQLEKIEKLIEDT